MKHIIVFSLLVVLVSLLASCDNDTVYDEYKKVKSNEWDYNDSIKFEVDIVDTSTHYNLYVNLRHNFYFDWRNVWVKVITEYPNKKTEISNVNLRLSEADGKWYGKCSGDICDLRVGIQQNAIFPQAGKYKFTIIQDMRQNPLPKVMDVGFRVEKYKEGKK